MSKLQTVFIVGAGASHDFGFPVGETLQEDIVEFLLEDRQSQNQLNNDLIHALDEFKKRGMDYGQLIAHCDWMARTLPLFPSIDAFLEKQSKPNDATSYLGKLAIASIISRHEAECSLNSRPEKIDWREQKETWLGRAWPLLNEGGSEKKLENCLPGISFVTFNYDRCIEQFITLSISQSYRISIDSAKLISSRIPIEHVYGSLGDFFGDRDIERFGSCPYRGQCLPLVDKIKTFSEQVDSAAADRIKVLLSNADRIIFLGFSFGKINREFISELCSGAPGMRGVFGTAYKLSEQNRQIAEKWSDICFRRAFAGARFEDCSAVKFFEDHSLLFQ